MANHKRSRWELNAAWWLQEEPDAARSAARWEDAGVLPVLGDEGWREVPPAIHLQPWLYPDNPYWGPHVRRVNDSAWWYRTRFTLPQDEKPERWQLVFGAVDYAAEAWLNGQWLGWHEGGFAPFALDCTGQVQTENELLVRVTSPWDPIRRRGLTFVDEVYRGLVKGLYEHADGLIPPDVNPIGIWQPVWLEAAADVTIERVPLTVTRDEYDGSAGLSLRLQIHNRRPEPFQGTLHLYLTSETLDVVRADTHVPIQVPPGEQAVEQSLRIGDPQWWWPWDMGYPDRYRLRCTLYDATGRKLDVHEEVFGIRQVRLLRSRDALHYQINRVPFFIRGTTYMGGLYLSRLTLAQIEADLDRVQECGLNLIRVHVHVAPPELYEACDRRGILVWQDFELNWVHESTPEFEERAVALLRSMIDQLYNHPSIITWCCHNEPAALSFQDRNLTHRPDPRLYREATALDPSRPVFLCSGRREEDWMQSGDTHAYLGGAHGGHYLDVYGRRSKLVTEFGCEAPLNLVTLDETPVLANRLAHLRERIDDIQAYQAALLKYQIEWYRLTRFDPCGGYIQFMLVDLCPQVGCGVLDSARRPKAGLAALNSASQPVHVLLEYTASGPVAVWVVNDTRQPLLRCLVEWQVWGENQAPITRGTAQVDIPAQRAHRVAMVTWASAPERPCTVVLRLLQDGRVVDENRYDDPFHPLPRPDGYPWHMDPLIGQRCFGGPHARSSLRVFNTWYGRLAAWLFPVYRWAEGMFQKRPDPRLDALLRFLLG